MLRLGGIFRPPSLFPLHFNTTSDLTHITNSDTDIVISPTVISELMESIDPSETGLDLTVRTLIDEIIFNAKAFVARFTNHYFLTEEPIHNFLGLEFRSTETSLIEDQRFFRLVLNGKSIGIFSTEEIPLDDMYDVRLCIAESQLPEFSEDTYRKDPGLA